MAMQVSLAAVENIFSRMMYFEKIGDREIGHVHQHDHLTLLAKGKLRITIEGVTTEFTAPNMIYIHKDKVHELEALADETVAYCIHVLREKDTGNILDPSMIPKTAEGIRDLMYNSDPIIIPPCNTQNDSH